MIGNKNYDWEFKRKIKFNPKLFGSDNSKVKSPELDFKTFIKYFR